MSNEEMIEAFEHFVSQKGEGVILYSADGEVKLRDVLDLIYDLQSKNERLLKDYYAVSQTCDELKDMKFTQEHCNLYEENKWLRSELKHQQQTVKDKAKEILQYVGDLYDDEDQRFQLKNYKWHKDLCKRNGVEVE